MLSPFRGEGGKKSEEGGDKKKIQRVIIVN
jgi:hypothetical protein